jgi:hypothetical protein
MADVTLSEITASDVDGLLGRHLEESFDADAVETVSLRFALEHVAVVRGLLPPELFRPVRDEACAIMDRNGVSRDLAFEITDNTPRSMTTVGQPVIKREGPLIHSFYFAPSLLRFIGKVVGEPVHTCPYEGEHYVISRLGKSGDTHGWHWDDYTYGLILALETPPYTEGGFIQAAPFTRWDKTRPDVYGALLGSAVRSYALQPGDAYVIKTDTTMHRVHPIRGESRRTIVNMTLASTSDLTRQITHETNDVLFGGTSESRPAG